MARFAIASLIALGVSLGTAAHATEALAPSVAARLDRLPAEFTMSEAKRERLMIIQENMARQNAYERRHGYGGRYRDGYGGDYGYRRYGPPPPPYGYRRPYYDDRW
ncbi:hypothetical protein [Bosea sp. ANAM02]|uniref:hypothetical protein n=1 Tax=Bosea sp. ANAM02 TaxID=2020412 RepID=UPI00140EE65C|nr:hypothetical protein [Bosea sp. ANAM02]BCB21951.1 hypothetical protein OCUBac02_48450 [Bosea sp. ANAM02]